MWLYQLRIAWKSARRNPGHTALVLGGIAVGVAVSTLFAATRHSFARDPIPEKSGVLHYVRMDNWDPLRPYPGEVPRPPTQITYRDMTAIMKSKIPVRQAGMFKASLYVYPDPQLGRPTRSMVRMTLRRLLPDVQRPLPLRRRLGPARRRGARAGGGAERGGQRPAVRRAATASARRCASTAASSGWWA